MAWFQGELPPGFVRYSFPEPECYVHETCTLFERLQIGRFTYICDHSVLSALSPISIGSFCSIAAGFYCSTHDEPSIHLPSSYPLSEILGIEVPNAAVTGTRYVSQPLPPKPVTIGNDVWIGDHVTVAGGVTIGNGCVIGAKSVVMEDCVAYGIYAGSPAKLIRMRFSEDLVQRLEQQAWWDWPVETIIANARFFDTDLLNADFPQELAA